MKSKVGRVPKHHAIGGVTVKLHAF